MAVIRVNKTADYTVISNTHFKEKEMSLKAKGLLSLMLSLPDNWDYSIAGLMSLSKDGKDSVMNALTELEEFRYLKRTRLVNEKGQFSGYDYDIYEKPYTKEPQEEKPYAENPNTEKPNAENLPQLNTNISNTKKSKTEKIDIYNENFEKLWKLLKSTPYDRKSAVSKKRKKELFEMGYERVEKAINVYKQTQNPSYYFKRDRFFNEIVDNYLDREISDFANANKNRYSNATQLVTINGKEYECRNGKYYIPNGSGIEVNPYAEDDLPY